MGFYLNPHEIVKTIGRPIKGNGFAELMSEVKSGEALVGQFQRPMFKNTVVLYNENEFQEFANMVGIQCILLGYYAIPVDKMQGYLDYGPEELKTLMKKCGTWKE